MDPRSHLARDRQFREERDALLAALKRIEAYDAHDPDGLHETWKDLGYRCMAVAREAIAKVDGGRSTENGAPVPTGEVGVIPAVRSKS